ncbi:MAG: glycosyltransferase family 39 protein [Nitrospinota bacterium]|nr:glycosyltransferase family 39 protein [Nitrospinota bacterium]
MRFPSARKWLVILPVTAIILEAIAIATYFLWGGFDYTFPLVGRVYVNDWLKPFQTILAALIILSAAYIIPPGAWARIREAGAGMTQAVTDHRHGLIIGAIVALALFLRTWSMGHGISEYIFWIDAPQFIQAAQEYVMGNYMYETGYPHFSSHFVEWAYRAGNIASGFLGLDSMAPESNTLSLIARVLNLVYVLGMMAVIYRIGVLTGLPAAGTLGMFLLAISTINVQMSHYFINDMAMAFFSLLSIAAMAQNLKEERLRWYLLAGALAGISFACKYNGVLSFVFMGFIYLRIHRDRKSFLQSLGMPLKAVLVFLAVYVVISPTLWATPWEKYALTDRIAAGIAEPKGVPYIAVTGIKTIDGTLMFFYNWRYQMWVLEGLFHPLPLWLAIPSFAYAAYMRRWRLMFVWAGAMVAFMIGKIAKPNAAGWHFLNVSPFLLFMSAVGVADALEKIPVRQARNAVMALLLIFLVHGAAQDASFWALPPSKSNVENWKKENIGDGEQVAMFTELIRETGDARRHILAEFHSGSFGGSPTYGGYSVLRDLWWYVSLKDGEPGFFPTAHIGSKKQTAQVFAQNMDLITTDRAFATGPDTGLASARRFVRVEGAPEQILALASNAHVKPNILTLNFGRVEKTLSLGRGGSALIAVKRDENRTFLLNGEYVDLMAESELDAVWLIGANHQDIGDIYMSMGQVTLALKSYAKSRTPYSLLRIMALAERIDTRLNAFAALEKDHPRFLKTITTTPAEQLEWKEIAGYSETVFAAGGERAFTLDKFNRVGMPLDSHVITPGASMHGPYVALTGGDYVLKLKWMTRREKPTSFTVDVRTGRGSDVTISRVFQGAEAESGQAAIPFTALKAVDYPLEIRVGDVTGGPIILEEVTLSIDYLGLARKVISQGLAGLKSKKL